MGNIQGTQTSQSIEAGITESDIMDDFIVIYLEQRINIILEKVHNEIPKYVSDPSEKVEAERRLHLLRNYIWNKIGKHYEAKKLYKEKNKNEITSTDGNQQVTLDWKPKIPKIQRLRENGKTVNIEKIGERELNATHLAETGNSKSTDTSTENKSNEGLQPLATGLLLEPQNNQTHEEASDFLQYDHETRIWKMLRVIEWLHSSPSDAETYYTA